jgi:hypothetical protein
MTIEQLQAVYKAQPFRPFVLHLADGRQIPVNHPDFILAYPSGRTVFVVQPDDTANIVDLLLVSDIELKTAGNGAGKRRRR